MYSDEIEYQEEEPTPMVRFENESRAETVQSTLSRVLDELYGDNRPVKTTRVENEVRAYGSRGFEVIREATDAILGNPFYKNRRDTAETVSQMLECQVE